MTHDDSSPPCTNADSQKRPTASEPTGLLARGRRLSGHFFWYGLGIVLDQGLTHLLLFPLGLRMMGADAFGKFQFALGVVNNVGVAPSKGLNNTILRSYAGVSEERRPALLRTGFGLVTWVVGLGLVTALVACFVGSAASDVDPLVTTWIGILAVALAARNIATFGMVDLGPKRRFAARTFWLSVGSVLALVALPLIYVINDWGMPIGFALGHVLAGILLVVVRRRTFVGRPQLDKGMVRDIIPTWIVLFASTFFFLASRYIHRTVLGWYQVESFEAVSTFFAAAATLDLFMMPVSVVGLFGYQILSAHASKKRFPPRLLRWYGAGALAGCAFFFFIARSFGPWVLQLLYTEVADDALPLVAIILPGVSLRILMHTSRPFVMKFSPRRALLIIGVVSFVAHVGAAFALIPSYGLRGAAWAYGVGSGIVGFTWFGFFVVGFLRHGDSEPENNETIDNVDAE